MDAMNGHVTHVEFERSLVPPAWSDSVRVIEASEHKAAALSLSHAFADDDISKYLVISDDTAGLSDEARWKLHVDVMAYIVAAHCYDGMVTAIGPDYDGVALWLPPGRNLDGWWNALRTGLWRLRFRLSAEGLARYDELMDLLHETKAAVLGDHDADAWYLSYIGSKPSGRRRGHAGKLLEHVMEMADAEGRPIYLESSSAANNTYYARFGFEAKRDIFLTRGRAPVRLSAMVREPRSPGTAAYPSPLQVFGGKGGGAGKTTA